MGLCGKKFAVAMSILILAAGCEENRELKADSFSIEVKTAPSTEAKTYFKDVEDGTVVFQDDVDTSHLGDVQAVIVYEGSEYPVLFSVVDETAPLLKIKEKEFSFEVGASLEKINETINREIQITDNYDTEFAPLKVFEKDIRKAQTFKKKLSVKDTAGNISNEVEIIVYFKEKEVSSSQENEGSKGENSASFEKESSEREKPAGSGNMEATAPEAASETASSQGQSQLSSSQQEHKRYCEANGGTYDATMDRCNTLIYEDYSGYRNPDGSCNHGGRKPYKDLPWFNSYEEMDKWMVNAMDTGFWSGGSYGCWDCPNCGKYCVTTVQENR